MSVPRGGRVTRCKGCTGCKGCSGRKRGSGGNGAAAGRGDHWSGVDRCCRDRGGRGRRPLEHNVEVNTLLSRVTAPLRASARPCTMTPVCTVIEVSARMLPTKTEPVPSVAELPTCQKTLHSVAPLIRSIVLADAGDQRRVGLEDEDRVWLRCPSSERPLRLRGPCCCRCRRREPASGRRDQGWSG